MSAKKLFNDPDKVVDEALDALVATNPGVNALENHRVIVRTDLESIAGKVAIVCGGGSGHEPAFAGYVGKGCLSAAVAGSVFASPPPTSILAAILTLAEHNPSGILIVRWLACFCSFAELFDFNFRWFTTTLVIESISGSPWREREP